MSQHDGGARGCEAPTSLSLTGERSGIKAVVRLVMIPSNQDDASLSGMSVSNVLRRVEKYSNTITARV